MLAKVVVSSEGLTAAKRPSITPLMKVLFSWEIGAGMGHLHPHEPVLKHLCEVGHEVIVIARDVAKARKAFGHLSLTTLQSPISLEKPDPIYRPTPSMAHILHNVGYSEPESLRARIMSWQELVRLIQPELVLLDYSPTLQLALLSSNIPQVVIGTGFSVPPEQSVLSTFSLFQGKKFSGIPDGEARTLSVVNQALASLGLPTLMTLGDIWHSRCRCILKTFKELDHYPHRENGIYIGVPPSQRGIEPIWPEQGERRIFAYLKPNQLIGDTLEALKATGCQVLVSGDGLSRSVQKQFTGPSMRFESQAINLYEVLNTTDLVLNNANHGTSSHCLVEGVPLVVMPLQLEQQLLARQLCQAELALEAKDPSVEDIRQVLRQGLESQRLRKKVLGFQEKYQGLSVKLYLERLLEEIAKVAVI